MPDGSGTDRIAARSLRKMSSRRWHTEQCCKCDSTDALALSPARSGISSSSEGHTMLTIAEVLHVRFTLLANAGHHAGRVHVHSIRRNPQLRTDFSPGAALEEMLLEARPGGRVGAFLHLLHG